MTDTNVGKWDWHYAANPYLIPMGDSPAYRVGAEALYVAGCTTVEDWGAGYGWFEIVLGDLAPWISYVGVDGSHSPAHQRVIDDLVTRQTSVDGIFMRGVLEHNYDWQALLDNALASFTKLMVLVLFVPFTKKTPHEELQFEDEIGVPTLALNESVLYRHLGDFAVSTIVIDSPGTAYGTETLIAIERL